MNGISSIGLKGDSEFFRRDNNRILGQQKRIRSIKLKGFHLVLIMVIFVIAGFAAFKTGEFILTWEKFRVKSFKLLNSPGLETQKLKEILAKYDTNIFSLNIEELKNELITLREVKDAALSRKLPATIEIRFYLREPVFQVMNENQSGCTYDLVDKEGVALCTASERQKNLVTVKSRRRDDWKKILPYLEELDKVRRVIDYVGLKQPYGIMLKLKGIPEVFYPGENDFVFKINYYLKLKRESVLKKHRVKYVDLRFEDRFYLEYEDEEEVNG